MVWHSCLTNVIITYGENEGCLSSKAIIVKEDQLVGGQPSMILKSESDEKN
jgi:hypothetical protein